MRKGIKEILIERDGLSPEGADAILAEAKAELMDLIQEGDYESAHDICADYFGLEPDYLDELIFF